jgi:hypothetical protein
MQEQTMSSTNLVTAIIGIVVVSAFLGFLMWWLKSLPLTIIMLGVIGMMIWDVITALRSGNGTSPD